MEQAINTFTKGLQMDTNPMVQGNDSLTDALNATFITMNGNEVILQNDMGNRRVDNAFLPPGYQPVGMKEYGGVIYIAAYNPITNKSQIGSFPSPERKIDVNKNLGGSLNLNNFLDKSKNVETADINYLKADSILIPLTSDTSLRAGDKFIVYGNISSIVGELTNFNNVEGNKSKTPKNQRYTLSLGILNSQNEFVDITKSLCRWNGATIIDFDESASDLYKFNSGYFIKNVKSTSILDTVNDGKLILSRQKIEGNTYSYKLVGPLYLKAQLNHIQNFNYNIYGIRTEKGKAKLWIEGFITYNCPDKKVVQGEVVQENYSDGDEDYYTFDEYVPTFDAFDFIESGKSSKENPVKNPEKEASRYNKNTNTYYTKITKEYNVEYSNDVYNYTIGVLADYMTNNLYLKDLSVSSSINMSLLGTNKVYIRGWKFYNNLSTYSTTLTFSFEAYPQYGTNFGNLKFKFHNVEGGQPDFFYPKDTDDEKDGGLPLYNGRQTYVLDWADWQENSKTFQPNKTYKVSIYYSQYVTNTGEIFDKKHNVQYQEEKYKVRKEDNDGIAGYEPPSSDIAPEFPGGVVLDDDTNDNNLLQAPIGGQEPVDPDVTGENGGANAEEGVIEPGTVEPGDNPQTGGDVTEPSDNPQEPANPDITGENGGANAGDNPPAGENITDSVDNNQNENNTISDSIIGKHNEINPIHVIATYEIERWLLTTELFNDFYPNSSGIIDYCDDTYDLKDSKRQEFYDKMIVRLKATNELTDNSKEEETQEFVGGLVSTEQNIEYYCEHNKNLIIQNNSSLEIINKELYPTYVKINEGKEKSIKIDSVELINLGNYDIKENDNINDKFKDLVGFIKGSAYSNENSMDNEILLSVLPTFEDNKINTTIRYYDKYKAKGSDSNIREIKNAFTTLSDVITKQIDSKTITYNGALPNYHAETGPDDNHYLDLVLKCASEKPINDLPDKTSEIDGTVNGQYVKTLHLNTRECDRSHTFLFRSDEDLAYQQFNEYTPKHQMFTYYYPPLKCHYSNSTNVDINSDSNSNIGFNTKCRVWWKTPDKKWALFKNFMSKEDGLIGFLEKELGHIIYCAYENYIGDLPKTLYTSVNNYIYNQIYNNIPLIFLVSYRISEPINNILNTKFDKVENGQTKKSNIGNLQFDGWDKVTNLDSTFTYNLNSSIKFFDTINKFDAHSISNIDLTTGSFLDINGNPLNENYIYTKTLTPDQRFDSNLIDKTEHYQMIGVEKVEYEGTTTTPKSWLAVVEKIYYREDDTFSTSGIYYKVFERWYYTFTSQTDLQTINLDNAIKGSLKESERRKYSLSKNNIPRRLESANIIIDREHTYNTSNGAISIILYNGETRISPSSRYDWASRKQESANNLTFIDYFGTNIVQI